MAQCLSSPSSVAKGFTPHKATRAALPTCPKCCCCLSPAALCTDRITSRYLYLAARKMWMKVGKCCPSWKEAALDTSKSETFFILSPSTVESGATILILISKWKKEMVLLQPFWFHCWKPSPAATELLSWCQDDVWLCQMENCSSKHEPQGQTLTLAFGLDSSLNRVSLVYEYSCFPLSHLSFL